MQRKLLNLCLLLTSLIGYLEWGKTNSSFLWQVEYMLLFGAKGNTDSFTHPFVLVPLLGQALLLVTLFQKTPHKALTITGLVCLSLIMVFIFFIGLMSMNMKIALSAVPFIASGIAVVYNLRKKAINA